MKIPETEEGIQRATIEALQTLGYKVLQTSRRYRPCPGCGKIDHRGDGVTEGLPDLMVTHGAWPRAMFLGLEMKGPATKVSEAQQVLAAASRILVARSAADAVRAIQGAEYVALGRVCGRRGKIG